MPHAIRIDRHGGPEVLRYVELELAPPGAGEVRLRQTAVGINFADVYARTGLYPTALPAVLGQEAAGVVEALGPGVTDLALGDRVVYAGSPGAYATARNVPVDVIVKIPDGVDDETAAAMMLKGTTAEYLLLRTYPVRAGETIVFHSAAGGVGSIACQWARHLGAVVIGTVGSEEKVALARANGCEHVVVLGRDDLAARVREITGGRGVPVVYDAVGRDTFEASLDCLSPRGTMVSYGNASGPVPPVLPLKLTEKGSLFLTRPSRKHYTLTRAETVASAAALFDVVARGAVRVDVRQRYPLADAARAHAELEGRRTTGASVLLPGAP
ncbi:MAG: quinone oxidoreductase [Deltaproteobacteria bacterium]|nr:quinone oxidoreductase [Myxococcales bacterium]MDP3217559.1 quinone oxidoreductase [Deltaproteobacteria bacterium]